MLKAENKLPKIMEEIPTPGLLTVYIDPKIRTRRMLHKPLLSDVSINGTDCVGENTAPGKSFYGVTKLVLKDDDNETLKTMYKAKFTYNHKTVTLGVFSTMTEAARAFDEAAVASIGPSASLNFNYNNYTSEGGAVTASLLRSNNHVGEAIGDIGNTDIATGTNDGTILPRLVERGSPHPFHQLVIPPNLLGKCIYITECFEIFHRTLGMPQIDLTTLASSIFLDSVTEKNRKNKTTCENENETHSNDESTVDYVSHALAQMHILLMRAIFNSQREDETGLFCEERQAKAGNFPKKSSRLWLLETAINENHTISNDIPGQIGIYKGTVNLLANPHLEEEFNTRADHYNDSERKYETSYGSNFIKNSIATPISSRKDLSITPNSSENYSLSNYEDGFKISEADGISENTERTLEWAEIPGTTETFSPVTELLDSTAEDKCTLCS